MNWKKFALTAVVMFVAVFALDYVTHGILLQADYSKMPDVMRAENDAMRNMPFMALAQLMFALSMAWIYMQGVKPGPWLPQGIRFGLAVSFLASTPIYLIYYAVTKVPWTTAAKQMVYGIITTTLLGVICAAMNKPAAATISETKVRGAAA